MHSAEHILNGEMARRFNCGRAFKAHVERKKSKLDYHLPMPLSPEQIEELREQMGLNDPVLVQYVRYIWGLLHGDMQNSYNSGLPCQIEIFARFPNTLRLTVTAITLSVVLALPIGV